MSFGVYCGSQRQPSSRRAGFTMIELLIVLAIITILFSMSLGALRKENRDAVVQAEAERLAAVLRRTRNRAVSEAKSYGVAFHIQNAVGTSGAILNNWDGGHWYRVIGSDGGKSDNVGSLPIAGRADAGRVGEDFPDFVENVKDSWVAGEQYVLPSRSVRFLALSDTDEGPRRNFGDQSDSSYREYNETGTTVTAKAETYPRPWFGYYDENLNRLFAWGGYDPEIPMSGFHYEGDDGTITGSTHPSDRSFVHDFNGDGAADVDLNGDGDFDDYWEQENPYYIWRQGEPRALVEADWLDAVIAFNSDGEAKYLEWNRGRRAYENDSSGNTSKGVHDRAKMRHDSVNFGTATPDPMYTAPETDHSRDLEDNGGAEHFNRHTGGFHITLAPDAPFDDNAFPSVQEAIDTMYPAWRVYVGENGAIRAFRVQRRVSNAFLESASYINSLDQSATTAWPTDPADWYDSNTVYQECRRGWLHQSELTEYENNLTPTGYPIVDVISGRMLTDRIWWVK